MSPPPATSPGQLALRRLRRNPLAWFSISVLVVFSLAALFAYALAPDHTPGANRQLPALAKLPPGSEVPVLVRQRQEPQPQTSWVAGLLHGWPAATQLTPLADSARLRISADSIHFRHASGRPDVALLPAALFRIDREAAFTQAALRETSKPYRLQGGRVLLVRHGHGRDTLSLAALAERRAALTRTLAFPLGTDPFGRDLLSRLLLGARISLGVGTLAVFVSLSLGMVLGALAGYFGGRVDAAVQWLMSLIWSVPSLLLALVIAFALGRGLQTLALAVGLATWVDLGRVVRGEILGLRERAFVAAARVMAFSPGRILRRHLLPNLTGPIAILACANFATAILLEAGLSFLGLGVEPPTPSWGSMIFSGYRYIILADGQWMAIFPGLCIVLLILALNVLALSLRDALDPRGG